jgi:thioesterase domain-containing protein
MTPAELEHYLHAHIPLTRAMQLTVREISAEQVVISAPLAPNVNHQGTMFGGSASTLAIVAAWSLLHTRLRAAGLTPRLVIQRNTMDYEAPIDGECVATAVLDAQADWEAFVRTLQQRGRARIAVNARLVSGGRRVGQLAGNFVARV